MTRETWGTDRCWPEAFLPSLSQRRAKREGPERVDLLGVGNTPVTRIWRQPVLPPSVLELLWSRPAVSTGPEYNQQPQSRGPGIVPGRRGVTQDRLGPQSHLASGVADSF